jgi:membrane associated rhomboid family serine protease
MGLADRDYLRNRPRPEYGDAGTVFGGGRGFAARSWSVTTWLIVICVAVFFLDRVLQRGWPNTYVPLGEYAIINPELFQEYDRIPESDRTDVLSRATPNSPVGERVLLYRPTGSNTAIPIASERVLFVPPMQKYLHFTTAQALMFPSATKGLVGFQFWRFFGYQFLHADWLHVLLNMMGLWFFGLEVERFLGRKRFLAFYLVCGFFGALVYMVLNAGGVALVASDSPWVRPFLPNNVWLPLIGASGSVYGVIIAGACLAPDDVVDLFGIIPMRLRTLAVIMIATALFALFAQTSNAGGQAAHLGGAMAGLFFIRKPHVLNNFFNILGRVDPTSRTNRTRREQKRMAVVRMEVDAILDKVQQHGIQSLTERERAILRQASRD